MIEISGLKKVIGNRILFQSLNFVFPSCGLFQIRGDNGCGKTTLLHILSLWDNDFEGNIKFGDLNFNSSSSWKEKEKFRIKNIDYIFPNNNFFNCMNMKENFEVLGLKFEGKDPKQNPYTLSGGEQILFALEKAKRRKKPIVLLDEVTSQLDTDHCDEVMKSLMDLKDKSLIILVTHDERTRSYSQSLRLTKEGLIYD